MFKYFSFAVVLGAICTGDAADTRNPLCKIRNGYYAVEGNCDTYVECREYSAREMLCPDGLNYNPKAQWPAYPCAYPMDAPCLDRDSTQSARATADCPHQYGIYASPQASSSNCGQYRMCLEGRAVDMLCPTGLAFNADNAQCDWPELVPSCDAESFLAFKCPPAPLDAEGKSLDTVINYKYEGSCHAFFSCHEGRARLLTCDYGYAFDAKTGRCEDAERVACDIRV